MFQEVKISQVLPGYAPSYASDYIPSQVLFSSKVERFLSLVEKEGIWENGVKNREQLRINGKGGNR